MLYLLFGLQDLSLKNRLHKLLQDGIGEINNFNFVQYNFNEANLEEVLFECTLVPLGCERRAIVIDNADFLSPTNNKKHPLSKEEEKALLDYLDHPNDACDLFMIVHNEKLDEKNSIVKKVIEKSKVIETVNPSERDWIVYASRLFEKAGVLIDRDALAEFVNRMQKDAMLMKSEVEKLSLYNNIITMEDLDIMIAKPLDEKVISMFEHVVNRDYDKAIELFRNSLVINGQPVMIINLLASQLRIYLDIFILSESGYSQDEISKTLAIHPYRVKLAMNNRYKISIDTLKEELENLYQLDYKIKSGKIDGIFGVEMFILNFNRKKKRSFNLER